MPDPFGITQVDIPGIYGAVQNAHMGRIQQMLGERQIAAADRQAERENRFNTALTGLYRPTPAAGASSGASGSASPAPPINPVVAAYGATPPGPAQPAVTPAGLPGANPAGTPVDTTPRLDPNVSAQLLTIDPERAGPMITQLRALDTDRIHQLSASNDYLARLGVRLLNEVPEAQWHQTVEPLIPDLLAHGVTQQQIQQFELSRENVTHIVNQAQDIDHLVAAARPDLHNENGQIIDYNALPHGTSQNPVVYTDPILNTGAGPFLRSSVMGNAGGEQPPQPGEVRQTSRGPMRFRGGDYRDQANYEPAQGGAPQPDAAGTFPRQDGGAFDFRANP